MAFVYLITIILWISAEIAMFGAVGSAVGVLLTIIGIFVTGMIGISLLRSQGRHITGALQAQLARGEAPVASLAAGVSILSGAVLMLIPGYLTDAAGLVLFLPGIRTIVGALLLKRMTARGSVMMGGRMPFGVGTPFGPPPGAQPSPEFGSQRGFGPRRGSGPKRGPGMESGPDHHGGDIIEGDFEERSPGAPPIDGPTDTPTDTPTETKD